VKLTIFNSHLNIELTSHQRRLGHGPAGPQIDVLMLTEHGDPLWQGSGKTDQVSVDICRSAGRSGMVADPQRAQRSTLDDVEHADDNDSGKVDPDTRGNVRRGVNHCA
jgi:hypothetical protein